MNFLFGLFSFYFALSGCTVKNQQNCEISITNNSRDTIDSVKITTYSVNAVFRNLLPATTQTKMIDINSTKKDQKGAFLARVYIKDSVKNSATFGYFAQPDEIKPAYSIEFSTTFPLRKNKLTSICSGG